VKLQKEKVKEKKEGMFYRSGADQAYEKRTGKVSLRKRKKILSIAESPRRRKEN